MEIQQLRYFMEVARRENITKSAKALNVVQPAITQALNRLETELGVKLFTPYGRGIKITTCGKYLYGEVLPILDRLERIPGKIRSMETNEDVVVHICIQSAWTLVTEAIIEYQRIDHLLQIEATMIDEDESTDICITTTCPQRLKRQFRPKGETRTVSEQIYLAVPNTSCYRNRKSIKLNELDENRFITLSRAKPFRHIRDDICSSAGIHPRYVFESDSQAAVMNAIAVGMGVGFWPEFSWEKTASKQIHLLKIEDFPCQRDINIIRNPTRKDNTRINIFYEFLSRYLSIYSKKNLG